MNQLFILILLLSSTAFAGSDLGLDDLRKSFQKDMNIYIANLDVAKNLVPLEYKLGREISKTDCIDIQEKAKRAATINPFLFVYEGGISESQMCGDQSGLQRNYILNKSGKTSFGRSFDLIVQLRTSPNQSKDLSFASYYFNSQFEIVNLESVMLDKTGQYTEFFIATKDSKGSLYQNYFNNLTSYPQRLISGQTSIQQWTPYDGSVHHSITRTKVTDAKNSQHSFLSLGLSRVETRDWDDFALPLTHSILNGGFYVYSGKYFNAPRNYVSLNIKFKDGNEFCSFAMTLNNQNWAQYPLDKDSFYQCYNF